MKARIMFSISRDVCSSSNFVIYTAVFWLVSGSKPEGRSSKGDEGLLEIVFFSLSKILFNNLNKTTVPSSNTDDAIYGSFPFKISFMNFDLILNYLTNFSLLFPLHRTFLLFCQVEYNRL